MFMRHCGPSCLRNCCLLIKASLVSQAVVKGNLIKRLTIGISLEAGLGLY